MKCERWIDQHDTSEAQISNLSARQESNPELPNTGRPLYPLSYTEELMNSKVI